MYFTYVDETGIDGKSPVLVMVGIVVDATRLRLTQEEFGEIAKNLTATASGAFRELKANDLLRGNGAWNRVPASERIAVTQALCEWLGERRHKLALAAIPHAAILGTPPGTAELRDAWQAAAWHIALQVQRSHQKKPGGKGRTVLVFDDNQRQLAALVESMFAPPAWTDGYYERARKQRQMDQIVDTPFAVRSHHVGLVQVADLYATIFRRYAEVSDFDEPERYEGERDEIAGYVALLEPHLLPRASRWTRQSSDPCARWYTAMAPASLAALG
ncbi:hypothetical protein Cch01nite_24700 [Cellulomonas chitinilytica]|uniref:DUF3800 domain-containing protein n=1 Tax=Cellulomonas chitinilytica TaxID=398759 RepID=A0A919P1P1_9CELL|nr:DUF3800 domain-containing protein [Cellulomonas chitinilytica]GIG21746.1 hypothetical protein Cch01nite_24700 [Cellulomonas chitinilytica]